MSKTTNKFAPEVRERAVRLALDQESARHPNSNLTTRVPVAALRKQPNQAR